MRERKRKKKDTHYFWRDKATSPVIRHPVSALALKHRVEPLQ